MSPDAIELYRLILAEGPRLPHLVKSFYRIGPDRVTARVAKELRLWAERERVRTATTLSVDDAFAAEGSHDNCSYADNESGAPHGSCASLGPSEIPLKRAFDSRARCPALGV
jgi:hypothetical protein